MSDIVSRTERLYKSIGQVIVEFQFIEHTLSEILSKLLQLNEPEDTYRVLAAMSYRQKVDLISDIYDRKKPHNWPSVDFKVTRKALYTAENFRNRVVHSFWHVATDAENEVKWMSVKSSIKTPKGLKLSAGEVNIQHLEESVKPLHDIRGWYLGLTDDVFNANEKLKKYAEEIYIKGTNKNSI